MCDEIRNREDVGADSLLKISSKNINHDVKTTILLQICIDNCVWGNKHKKYNSYPKQYKHKIHNRKLIIYGVGHFNLR